MCELMINPQCASCLMLQKIGQMTRPCPMTVGPMTISKKKQKEGVNLCQYVERSEPIAIEAVLGGGLSHNIRLKNFQVNGIICVSCGLTGLYFRKERHRSISKHKSKHYNLYGVDRRGREVLMTRDHILPVSLGGPDKLYNLRTLCSKCNSSRGNPLEFPLISACPIQLDIFLYIQYTGGYISIKGVIAQLRIKIYGQNQLNVLAAAKQYLINMMVIIVYENMLVGIMVVSMQTLSSINENGKRGTPRM